MRIVYFLPDIDAGVSRIVKNLLLYRTKDTAIQYAVVLFRRDDQQEKAVDTDFNADETIRVYYKETENAFSVFKKLSKTLHSSNDVIVGNDGLEVKMVAALRLQNPLIYIVHGDFSDYYNIIQHYHTVMNGIISYSNKIDKEVKAKNGVDHKLVYKLYYPSAAAEKVRLLDSDAQSRDIFKIVFAGLVIERKGADLLPAIYNKLIEMGIKDFELEIIGEGPLLQAIRDKLGSKQNIVFAGWQNEAYVVQKMKGAHVFLFPSRREGLPNVLVEAMASGAVPVVSNIASGVADIVQHNYNGMLVNIGDVSGFANSIESLFKDRNKLKLFSKNAIESISLFEPNQQAKKYEDLIFALVKNAAQFQRIFPKYKKGRVLDIQWLPGWIVMMMRKLITNPKL